MKSLPLRSLIACIAATAIATVFPSCAVFHAGAPAASLVVHSNSEGAVEDEVIEAFTERNFRLAGNARHDLTFERDANKMDSVLYGNWNGDKLTERVVVQIIEIKPDEFRLSCIPFAVRSLGTGMDDATRRFQTFSAEYSQALRDAREGLRKRAALEIPAS